LAQSCHKENLSGVLEPLDSSSLAEIRHGIGVDFHEARFPLGRFPAAGLSGIANELAGGESAVNPLGTAASAVVRIRLPTGRIMAGVDAQQCASHRALQRTLGGGHCTIAQTAAEAVYF